MFKKRLVRNNRQQVRAKWSGEEADMDDTFFKKRDPKIRKCTGGPKLRACPFGATSNQIALEEEMTSAALPPDAYVTVEPKPVRAKSVLPTVFVDYQPDVCKEYKLTGYCGYGDNCKFLHIRESYAASWQIDKESDFKNVVQQEPKACEPPQPKLDDKCNLCKSSSNLVRMSCNHISCQSCFLECMRQSPLCPQCKRDTGGHARMYQPAKKE